MMDSTDMTTPVTRGELHEVLSQVKQEQRRDLREVIEPLATKAAIEPLATKVELAVWGGAVVARMQQGEQRIDRLEQQFQQFEQRMFTELARHTSAILEAMRTEIKACVEPFADLPGRMDRVEAAVFGPKSPARRTRRKKN